MSGYEKIGEGEYGVYRKKKTNWGEIFGGILLSIVVVLIIGAIAS